MTPYYEREIRIEWGDCDPAGIVFAPRYFDMFSENTIRLFEHAGLPKKRLMLREMGVAGFPLVDVSARFLRPGFYGDDGIVQSAAPEFGNSSFVIRHRLLLDGLPAVECTEKRVWAIPDPDSPGHIRSQAVPEEIRVLFAHVHD